MFEDFCPEGTEVQKWLATIAYREYGAKAVEMEMETLVHLLHKRLTDQLRWLYDGISYINFHLTKEALHPDLLDLYKLADYLDPINIPVIQDYQLARTLWLFLDRPLKDPHEILQAVKKLDFHVIKMVRENLPTDSITIKREAPYGKGLQRRFARLSAAKQEILFQTHPSVEELYKAVDQCGTFSDSAKLEIVMVNMTKKQRYRAVMKTLL